MSNKLNVVELFAGVGGFRLGLKKQTLVSFKQYGQINGSLGKKRRCF